MGWIRTKNYEIYLSIRRMSNIINLYYEYNVYAVYVTFWN